MVMIDEGRGTSAKVVVDGDGGQWEAKTMVGGHNNKSRIKGMEATIFLRSMAVAPSTKAAPISLPSSLFPLSSSKKARLSSRIPDPSESIRGI
ncbi:hypothetical protein KFK09_016986 [Dendrobium nobile]|uniref:Uncharacterized protein n=1 Tax=Dendrobium nobile TaxID=94219 RepID=A0A8T3B124_DENNO|nr:hypothetical protein KFK09_016986 [Dendrobium nobile]